MKTTLTLFLLLFSGFIWAQPFHPIPPGIRSMFVFNTMMDITVMGGVEKWEEVYTDSIYISGSDTILKLNSQVRIPAETEYCSQMSLAFPKNFRICNQAGNIGSACIIRPGQGYGLVNPYGDTLWLKTHETIGTYWDCRPHIPGFDTAKIIAFSLDTIPGFPADSVVQIQYYGNRRIEISKNFGILYFDGFMDKVCPLWSTATPTPKYKLMQPAVLIGQKNQGNQYGKKTAYPKDAYSFNSGDIWATSLNIHNHGYPPALDMYYYWVLDTANADSNSADYTVRRITYSYNITFPPETLIINLPNKMPGTGIDHAFVKENDLMNGAGSTVGLIWFQTFKNGIAYLDVLMNIRTDTCSGMPYIEDNTFEHIRTITLVSEGGLFNSTYIYGVPIDQRIYDLSCLYKPGHPLSNSNCGYKVDRSPESVKSSIQLYPNPAKEYVTLSAPDGMLFDHPIYITDVLGKLILMTDETQNPELQIVTRDLKPGFYNVETYLGNVPYRIKLIISEN